MSEIKEVIAAKASKSGAKDANNDEGDPGETKAFKPDEPLLDADCHRVDITFQTGSWLLSSARGKPNK